MPVNTHRTLDLNANLQFVNDKKTKLKSLFLHNRSRNMCWVKFWDAKNVADINFGVTPPKMTLSASSSLLANGTEFATTYYFWDLEFSNGVVIAGTSGWRDDNTIGYAENSLIANLIYD